MANEQKPKQATAAQRIEALEQVVTAIYQSANKMAQDLSIAKEAIKLLGNKLDSVVQAIQGGKEVNDKTIADLMTQNNLVELKTKVEALVEQKILSPTDTVAEDTFVVGEELDAVTDAVLNPRLQFALTTLKDQVVKDKINGSKVGDILTITEGKMRFKVTEVYKFMAPDEPASEDGDQEDGLSEPTESSSTAEAAAPTSGEAPQA